MQIRDSLFITSDLKAIVGLDKTDGENEFGPYGIEAMIKHGERFADFCAVDALTVKRTYFPHKFCHPATWV